MRRNLVIIAALAVVSLTACNEPVPVEREFICEDDGVLVERHVGVRHAFGSREGSWDIQYVEGSWTTYRQAVGESCRVEEYTP